MRFFKSERKARNHRCARTSRVSPPPRPAPPDSPHTPPPWMDAASRNRAHTTRYPVDRATDFVKVMGAAVFLQ